ncbi:hypothetical protein GO002_25605 [Streptomyces eurocidicus]|uniref:Uncharacterized protein n=1 Tax=Streptomyces eurocidicus TaxID=66423 RepID=A0A7W8F633_STREU|nr:hypothetical protein [Streptomyces eurocidicus]MBF6055219.1 hypothetical protein [Streptomyces eurocidicus]
MTDQEAKRQTLRYTQEISLTDVDLLQAFLRARTARLANAERGTDERQLARSVRTAARHLVTSLQHMLPLTEKGDEAPRVLQIEIRVSWNALWSLVSPWQWHEDYDLERWRPVKVWSATSGIRFDDISERDGPSP